MNKNLFLKSTIILTISGIITKIFGFIIRVITTRIVGSKVISLYSIVLPTYSLLITIATLALPTTISKLVAENKIKKSTILGNSLILITLINIIVVTIMFLSSKYIANNLLHEPRVYLILLSATISFPIVSISSIIKGYFYGNMNMVPNAISNIIEQITRYILIIFIVPICMNYGPIYAASSLFLISFITEFISIIVNILFLPKKIKIKKEYFIPDKDTVRDILGISIPSVSSRIIGNIGYFFEPIILMNILMYSGYTKDYILNEYGIFNSYSIPILTVPSFFIIAISLSLVPEISKYYSNNNILKVKSRFKQAIIFSLIIGILYSIILLIYGDKILYIIYNTYEGINYIKILSIVFPLFYLESILISFLQAINKAHITMKITLIGVIIKLLSMSILSLVHIGIYSLIIAEIINIFIVVLLNFIEIKKTFKPYKYQSLSPSL